VHLLETTLGNVGVNLGCREVFVPEEFLDDPQVGPTFEEMCGEGVAKGVRVQVSRGHTCIKESADISSAQGLAPTVQKNGAGITICECLGPSSTPGRQRGEAARVQGHESLLATFTQYT
jgi:hypothetical protein